LLLICLSTVSSMRNRKSIRKSKALTECKFTGDGSKEAYGACLTALGTSVAAIRVESDEVPSGLLIQTEVTTLEKSKTPENLLWSSVKKFFASESDKTQIKKFLYLRLADIKVMIEAVLIMTDNPVFVKCKSTDNTFSATGTIARFETACVNVKKSTRINIGPS